MRAALGWALAALVAATPAAAVAKAAPARGDVVQFIRMSRKFIQLPEVPGGHYERKTDQGRKVVNIRPAGRWPEYAVIATEHGVRTADAWFEMRRDLSSKIWAEGWTAIGGVRCPWFDGGKRGGTDGPRIRLLYITDGWVAAELWYIAADAAGFKKGLPAFEKFAAGIRIR